MSYISLNFYLLTALLVLLYYVFPLSKRWLVLLVGSAAFFFFADRQGIPALCWMIVSAFLFGKAIRNSKRLLLPGIIVSVLPFWIHLVGDTLGREVPSFFLPLGLSYLSLQAIGYLVDVSKGKCEPAGNVLKFALFLSFFPQVVQGPIPRYGKLAPQLVKGHKADEENFQKGFVRILLGLALKFLIADRAGIPANTFYAEAGVYTGIYAWLGMVMFMVQLYADFLGCVLLSIGTARLFGIELQNNFNHPYSSRSTAEIWTRWHISLSLWLRDYIYFPLGGSRKGTFRKYLNLTAVFVVSAIWHGVSLTYLAWGLLTAGYQIIGELTFSFREKLYQFCHIPDGIKSRIRQAVTALLFVLSSLLFRSYGFRALLTNMRSLMQGSMRPEETGCLGLTAAEWVLLGIAVVCFGLFQHFSNKKNLEIPFFEKPWGFRYAVYLCLMVAILIFGTYGFGFDAGTFIYGGF